MSTNGSGTDKKFGAYKEINYDTGVAVQNQWYTALDVVDAEVIGLEASVAVANETLELRVTLDGEVINTSAGVACTAGGNASTGLPGTMVLFASTGHTFFFTQTAAHATPVTTAGIGTWCRGHTVKIEVRKTTAGGAATIHVSGVYFRW